MTNRIVRVTKAFPYSPNGIHVDEYQTGVQRLSAEVADFAIEQKWAKDASEKDVQELEAAEAVAQELKDKAAAEAQQ